jgi:hypothetical protein
LHDLTSVLTRVEAVGGKSDLERIALLEIFRDALVIKEQILELKQLHLVVWAVFFVSVNDLCVNHG